MEHATVQTPAPRARPRPRYGSALGGVALVLAAGLGTPLLAGAAARAWDLPLEAALVVAFVLVGLAFLGVGWSLGRRVDALADSARREPMTPVTKVGDRRHSEERPAPPASSSVIDLDERRRSRKRHTRGSR